MIKSDHVSPDEHARIAEAALVFLDVCRSTHAGSALSQGQSAENLNASTLALAIQAIAMADLVPRARSACDAIVETDKDRIAGIASGMGLGCGTIIGSFAVDVLALQYVHRVFDGSFAVAMAKRANDAMNTRPRR